MAEDQTALDPFAEFSDQSLFAKQPDPFAEFSSEAVTAEVDEFVEFSAEPLSVESGERSKFEQFREQQEKGAAIARRREMRDATVRQKNIEFGKNLLKAPIIGAVKGSLEIQETVADFLPMPNGWETALKEDVADVRSRMPTAEEQGVTAGVVSTLTQFGIPFGALIGKIGTSANLVTQFFKAAALGATVDVAVFDENEARLSDFLTKLDNPVLNNTVTQFMVSRDDDSALMSKIRQMAEGAAIGLTGDAFITLIQSVKAGKIFANFKKLGGEKPLDPLSDEALAGLESSVGQKFGVESMDVGKMEAVEGFQTGARVEEISRIADDIQTGVRVPSTIVEVETAPSLVKDFIGDSPWEMPLDKFARRFKTVWDEYKIEIDAVESKIKPAFYFVSKNKNALEHAKKAGLRIEENITRSGDFVAVSNDAAGEQTLEQIVDLSRRREAVFKTEDEEAIQDWNEEFSKLLGYTEHEALSIQGVFGYADRATEAERIHRLYIQDAIARGRPVSRHALKAHPDVDVPEEEVIPVRILSGADDVKASQMLATRADIGLKQLKVKTLPVDSVEAMKVNSALVDQANQQSRKAKADLHENFRTRIGRWASAEKWVDASSDIKKALLKSGGSEGKVAVMMHDLAAGATPKAAHSFQTYARDIYKGLDSAGERMLDDVINSRRVVEIDNYKGVGKIKHMGGLTGREHGDKLKMLEAELGPDAWSDVTRRADSYFDAMKEQLLDLRKNKIIDETLYEKLKNFDYRPIRYLDIIDPIRAVDIGGRKISVRDSGIALLEQGKNIPIELSSRELLTQVVGRTQNRIARNNANLALREVGLQFPDNGVVRVPNVVDPPKSTQKVVTTPGESITQHEALLRAFSKAPSAIENKMTFEEWLEGIGGPVGSEARVFISIEQRAAVKSTEKIVDIPTEGTSKDGAKKPDLSKIRTPKGFSRVSVLVDGEPQPLFIDAKLAGQWVTQNPQITREWAEALRWSSGSPIVRALATGHNPGFAFTNFPRDLMHIYMSTQEYSRHLPIAMGQISRDLASTFTDAVRKKGAYVDYINEGGGMNFLTHQGRDVFVSQPDSIRKQLDPKFAKLKEVTGYVGETSELWTRLMLRQRAMRNGKSNLDATWTARNYMDFGQGGSWAKAADHQIPYLNATIQALRGAMRSAKEDPKGFWTKVGWLQATAGGLTIANWMNHPDAMEALPDKECQDYWCFPTGGKTVDKNGNTRHHYWRVKKDDTMKPLLWPVDASMTWFFRGRAIDEGAFETLTETIPLMKGNLPIPTISAYATYASNHDFWFGDEIWRGKTLRWPLSKQEFKGEGQGPPTPKEWVAFGEATGLSPERGRAAFRQVIPRNPFMDLTVGGGQLGARMLGGESLLTDQEQDKTLPEMLNSMPIVRRFSHLTHPAETELTRTEEITDEALAKRLQVRRQYANQYNEFRRGRQSLSGVAKWIAGQPEEFRGSLEKQHEKGLAIDIAFASMRGVEGIPSSISWLQWMNQPPDVRAELFYKEYIGKESNKRQQMLKLGQRIPGFWSPDFGRFFGKLLNKQGREQH